MSATSNRQIVLRRRPEEVVTDECFELVEAPLRESSSGEVRIWTLWLSLDPAQRGWLNDVPSYMPPVELGAPMRSYGIGEVLASSHPSFDRGDRVYGFVG
jgi:NADPH-dependent curcumin reductase CurA